MFEALKNDREMQIKFIYSVMYLERRMVLESQAEIFYSLYVDKLKDARIDIGDEQSFVKLCLKIDAYDFICCSDNGYKFSEDC